MRYTVLYYDKEISEDELQEYSVEANDAAEAERLFLSFSKGSDKMSIYSIGSSLCQYNLEHSGVVCRAVDWESDEFTLEYIGRTYTFKPIRYISQTSDLDHIRCVINQFLEKFYEVADEEYDAHSCSEHADADGVCTVCGAILHGSIADHELHGY